MLHLTLLSLAFGADEPCYGHSYDDRLSSEHFWVEWEAGLLDEEKARAMLDAAENARQTYLDLGFAFTDRPVVFAVDDSGSGISATTFTADCPDGTPVPRIAFHVADWDEDDAQSVVAHETAHAAQYAYMGSYDDSVASWLWWMEGCAVWMTVYADGDEAHWADEVEGYFDDVHLALQHGIDGFAGGIIDQMYGTAWLARAMDDTYGGPDVVRLTWEYGGTVTGQTIFFPDAIEGGPGYVFDEFWAEYLATTAALDVEWAERLSEGPEITEQITELPASGSNVSETAPQGLGINIVRFLPGGGKKGRALQIAFDGEPTVEWHVVLVRTNGTEIVDYVRMPVESGVGTGHVSDYWAIDAWMMISPESDAKTGFTYSWDAELIEDPGPMEGLVSVNPPPERKGCGCATGSRAGWIAAAGALVVAAARGRREGAANRSPRHGPVDGCAEGARPSAETLGSGWPE